VGGWSTMTRFVVLMNDCECTLVNIFYPDLAVNFGMMDDKVKIMCVFGRPGLKIFWTFYDLLILDIMKWKNLTPTSLDCFRLMKW
jgi:hypothetical protein